MPPPSTDGAFEVDVEAIEDFQMVFNRLDARASTASGKIGPASAQGLGTFPQATAVITEHDRLRVQYQTRLEILRAAVSIANTKTSRLISNYRRTEDAQTGNMNVFLGPLMTIFKQIGKD